MDMIAGLFSLCLFTPLRSLAFLSLGLITLHLEIEAIEEDSWANHESVWAVTALIKRALLLVAKKKGLDNERAWGLFFAPMALSP